MSIFARNGRRDDFAAARNGGFSQTSPQSPLRAPLGHAAELGIVSLAHGQFRAYCASSEASGGTLPHTALPTPEAKECSCEVDPRRSTSSKQSDWRYAAISSTRKWLRYKTRHREERFFCCPQSRSFCQRA